ncbi:uncharacterized protein [Bombus fervidus]|uniref:uncharacterized protein n=1 Tax=Bombus fervidus TaxID=203811 RepID=UPI003D188ED9
MLLVHQCVAVVEVGFDAVAEERHRMCSIDPRTQPVLILRQSSFQIVPVVVCLLAAYSRFFVVWRELSAWHRLLSTRVNINMNSTYFSYIYFLSTLTTEVT